MNRRVAAVVDRNVSALHATLAVVVATVVVQPTQMVVCQTAKAVAAPDPVAWRGYTPKALSKAISGFGKRNVYGHVTNVRITVNSRCGKCGGEVRLRQMFALRLDVCSMHVL
mmetsp:Transcript_23028/g.36759  ORF Transcript_23028/g.36759 Transcript_23028/m.36759 type:complete len:112 (+) Transcript_23028:2447-2782(+)